MKQELNKFKEMILNLIYPKNIKCMFCSGELNQNGYNAACEDCLESIPFIENACERCGSSMQKNQTGVCLNCKSRNFYFVQAKSVFEYTAEPLVVVHNLKYNGKKYLAEYMAKWLAETFATWNIFPDIITNVPMFELKEKARGYNQSRLLAEEFSKLVKIPFYELCVKVVDTASQTDLNTKERRENVLDSFAFKREFKKLINGKIILIIDDVVTTGATCSEISKMLTEAKAKECYVLSFAHTYLPQISFEN